MYKLVAIDLDGTLLNDKKEISKDTINAIKEAKKKGVYVVICTGRPTEGIRMFTDLLKVDGVTDYFINFNGALIKDSTGKVIFEECLNGEDLKVLALEADRLSSNIHAFHKDEGLICRNPSEYTDLEASINKIDYKVADLKSYTKDDVIIKMMLIDKEEVLDKTIEGLDLTLYNKYQVVRSAPWFLEFVNKKVDKFLGVMHLAEYLGITKEEVICIGDAGNDIAMIKGAGLGVCMANGFEEVKHYAKYVTKNDNNHDGVKEVFDKFVL